MKSLYLLTVICVVLSMQTPSLVMAGPGHAHDDPAPVAVGEKLVRFTAVSDLFEIVGVLDGNRVTVYLDNTSDNSPVRDAQIELEIGNTKYAATKGDSDTFEVTLTDELPLGISPVTAMVITETDADLLAGQLTIDDAVPTSQRAHDHAWWEEYWEEYSLWIIGAVAVLLLIVFGGRQLLVSRPAHSKGQA